MKKNNKENRIETKETYLPQGIWDDGKNNDYKDSTSRFNIFRMKETDNLAAFWEAGFGGNPSRTVDPKYRFNLDELMAESEKIYCFFRDTLKFVEKGKSLTDKYRMNLYFFYNDEGTVYGGGLDQKIGAMWLSPNRIKTKPYAAVAHEMGHSFQYMVAVDGNAGFDNSGGPAIYEMTSQFMLFQFYPDWMTFENYHFQNFMKNTHKAFMHEDNMYCSPYVLEYWADKHGRDFIGRLWREARKGEDPVMAYKRITNIDQKTFNDEMLDAALKFMTWDINRIRDYAKSYANKHICELKPLENGWYRIAKSKCPQNYGYNGIRLNVPDAGTEIILDFKGIAGDTAYNRVNVDKAGWRYALMAEKNNGERIYGKVNSASKGKVRFIVPGNISYLWLVVVGAPTEHWPHIMGNKVPEQWPYKIKLTGTGLHRSVLK